MIERHTARTYVDGPQDRAVPVGKRYVVRIFQAVADAAVAHAVLAAVQLFQQAKVTRDCRGTTARTSRRKVSDFRRDARPGGEAPGDPRPRPVPQNVPSTTESGKARGRDMGISATSGRRSQGQARQRWTRGRHARARLTPAARTGRRGTCSRTALGWGGTPAGRRAAAPPRSAHFVFLESDLNWRRIYLCYITSLGTSLCLRCEMETSMYRAGRPPLLAAGLLATRWWPPLRSAAQSTAFSRG
jgi:hypothetical protein